MIKNLLNLSEKIDGLILELIEDVNNVAESMSVPFFIVGATVRDIYFASLPGRAIMKLISWDDRYPERDKDAKDLCFIIRNYLDAGNEERLFEEEIDIIDKLKESGDVDYLKAGARMLGRDIAVIAVPDTKRKVEEILERETGEKERYRLVEDMIDISLESSSDFEEYLESLEQLKLGLFDVS